MAKILFRNIRIDGVIKVSLVCAVMILAVTRSVLAADLDASKIAEMKALQKQQDQVMQQYHKNKQSLEQTFQKKLDALGKSKENEIARTQLIQETKQQQDDLKRLFQAELRELQQKQRKFRPGGSQALNIGRSPHPTTQVQQLQSDLLKKQQRQELLKKAQKQDETFFKNQIQVPNVNAPTTAVNQQPQTESQSPQTSQSPPPVQQPNMPQIPTAGKVRFRDPTQNTLGGYQQR